MPEQRDNGTGSFSPTQKKILLSKYSSSRLAGPGGQYKRAAEEAGYQILLPGPAADYSPAPTDHRGFLHQVGIKKH